jgi:hypothetical protein
MDQDAGRRVRLFSGVAQDDTEDEYPDERVEIVLKCVKSGEQKRSQHDTHAGQKHASKYKFLTKTGRNSDDDGASGRNGVLEQRFDGMGIRHRQPESIPQQPNKKVDWTGSQSKPQRDCNGHHDLTPIRPHQRQPLLCFPQGSLNWETDSDE